MSDLLSSVSQTDSTVFNLMTAMGQEAADEMVRARECLAKILPSALIISGMLPKPGIAIGVFRYLVDSWLMASYRRAHRIR
jgi:hypothetical protein